MKAIVDADTCTGCGLCADICAPVFELNDDGIAEVKVDPIPPDLGECCQEAADGCPVDAIAIED